MRGQSHFGGPHSITTAVPVALTVLPEMLRSFSEYRRVTYALLLIIVMLVRPQGLMGIREVWELPVFRRMFGGRT